VSSRRDPPAAGSYGREYFQRAYNLGGPRWTEINWWSVRFYASIAERVLRRGGGSRVLEIGCGLGFVLARLERRFETWGIDLSPYAVERARGFSPGSRLFVGDVTGELPVEVEEGGFDLVLARYVFEHLAAPGPALKRAAGLLAPGGALFYAVPDTTSPGVRLKGDDWYAYQDETHVSLLDPREWLGLTADAGLEVERSFSDGLWDVPYIRGVPRLIQYPMFTLPTIVSVLLARPMIPVGWGENVIVIARKPGGGGERPG
jgi:SAM-dependent methyltransferase